MKPLVGLLGSSTRANIVEVLATSRKPLSAYRVSKMYNMNVAKVYVEMKKLARLGLISSSNGTRGLEYTLIDENLRALALNLSPRAISYDDWRSAEAKAQRFRSGMTRVPDFKLGGKTSRLDKKPTRMTGELEALALLARSRFDKKYRRVSEHNYARI
jgi:hypothetical protein